MGKADVLIATFADFLAADAAVKQRPAAGTERTNRGVAAEACRRGQPAAGSVRNLVQNGQIYGEGDDADDFFKVLSGVVRTCRLLSDGRRQIDAFHVPGDMFGLEMGADHSLSAEAVCDSTVISYRRRGSETLWENGRGVSHQLFSCAMRSLARAQEHSILLGRRSATEKVAAFLIDWAADSSAGDVITLAMPRQDIADYLGLTTETVSRTLSHLERKALIERPTARQIRLKDPGGLRDLSA